MKEYAVWRLMMHHSRRKWASFQEPIEPAHRCARYNRRMWFINLQAVTTEELRALQALHTHPA